MNKIMMTTTSLAAGAALVLGGALAANAATPAPTSIATSTATSCSFGEHLVSAFRSLPEAMRDDLKAARAAAPGPERRKELKAIRDKALDGGYGAAVEAKTEFLKSHRGDITGIRPLPDDLKADLKTLRGEPTKADRVKEANAIADKALAGDYGTKVQTLAKDVKNSDAWQDCTPSGQGS